MVTPALRAWFLERGLPMIPLETGATAFVAELGDGDLDTVEVILEASPTASLSPDPRDPAALSFDVSASEKTHPYLIDHSIDDMPVLPAVMVLEWFSRAAKAARPDLQLVACHDLRVLRGVRLEGFHDGGDGFTVFCRPETGTPTRYQLELRGADGTLHYTATAELAAQLSSPGSPLDAPAPLTRFPHAIYGRELFHGPQFQVIQSLDGVADSGAVATLTGVRDRGWRGPWCLDVAAVDGGLQVAVLWTGHVLGGRALPTSIGAHRLFRSSCTQGPIRCTVRGATVADSKAVCDISFADAEGTLLSELRGVELHLRPDRTEPPR